MRYPSAAELIRVWELGKNREPWYRGLLLLAPLFPDSSLRDLSAVSLGTRNAYLLTLRQGLFGELLEAIVNCPTCQERIEFSIQIETLLQVHTSDCFSVYEVNSELKTGGASVTYRLLCSDDLQAARQATAGATALELTSRAVQDAHSGTIDDTSAAGIADAILTADPLADISLGIDCDACGCEWNASFDIVSFLWKEIEAEVSRLFDDVHKLGATYGWSEAVILTMSSHRRRQYLERAHA